MSEAHKVYRELQVTYENNKVFMTSQQGGDYNFKHKKDVQQ